MNCRRVQQAPFNRSMPVRKMHKPTSLWMVENGSAIVEAAIALPVLFALVAGAYEFGYLFYQEQLITSGVRDGARYLALSPDPRNTTFQGCAKNIAVFGSTSGGGTARLSGWSTANVSVSLDLVNNSSGTYNGGLTINGTQVIPVITVSTTVVDQSLGFLSLIGLNAPTINVSHQELWVGGTTTQSTC